MTRRRLPAALLVLLLFLAEAARAKLDPAQEKALAEATYVYVQSERKSGELGKPAEIWFFYDAGVVWVGTRPTSWRVRRIKAGRTRARIAIGKPDGPAFTAKGAVVRDPAVEERLMRDFARKYPEGWTKHEQSFREGFKSGERVLVRYVPSG
jgi:hypothetical protein